MYLRKDKFSPSDRYFMQIAVNLAKNNLGFTGSNPSVGCVVVKKNKIISFGATNYNGRPHAESIALNKITDSKGSTIYISLEPCVHFGKTPPCTSLLIKKKIKKVIYSLDDYDVRTKKKSKELLQKKNIFVKSGLLYNQTSKLYAKYSTTRKQKLPYITGKLACTANHKIFNKKKQITNDHSKNVNHILRSKNQAILTTYKTANIDNPKLNCRIEGLNNNSPVKIIIDKDLKIKKNLFLLKNKPKVFIFHSSIDKKKIDYLKNMGVILIYTKTKNNSKFIMKNIFKKIYSLGLHSVIVESGPKFLKEILNEKLFHEFYLFKSNTKIKDSKIIDVKYLIEDLDKKFKNLKKVETFLNNNTLIKYF